MAGKRSRAQQQQASAALEFLSGSAEHTQQLGEQLGRLLRGGDVIALCGGLGSGKTTLTQGLVAGTGGDSNAVKSPTFVLVREYGGPVPVIHMDAYRLEGAPSAAWLDVELLFSPYKITVIEWAERLEGLLPDHALTVHLEHASAHRRRIAVSPSSGRGHAAIEPLRAWIASIAAPLDAPVASPHPTDMPDAPAGD